MTANVRPERSIISRSKHRQFDSISPRQFYQTVMFIIEPCCRVRGEITPLSHLMSFILGYEGKYSHTKTNRSMSSNGCLSGLNENCTRCYPPMTNSSANTSRVDESAQKSRPFKFSFAPCFTPVVESLSPRWITKDTDVIIRGRGFSRHPSENSVKLGVHRCNVLSSTGTHIYCCINTTTSPPINTHLRVSMRVENRGHALIQIPSPVDETLRLRAVISEFAPARGSVAGGTKLRIKGSGFAGNAAMVTIGLLECKITRMTYTEIDCSTGNLSSLENKTLPLNVYINSEAAVCNQSNCVFLYDPKITPMIVNVLDREIRSSAEEITMHGALLGYDVSMVSVAIGSTICNLTRVNDTHIVCVVHGIPAGTHKLHVYKSPHGYAWFNTTDTVQCIASTGGVVPRRGSLHGRTEIAIAGVGFDPAFGRVAVTVGGRQCAIKSVTYQKVVCYTPAGTGSKDVLVQSGEVTFPSVTFTYDTTVTPTVSSLSLRRGHADQEVTLSGTNLGSTFGVDGVSIMFGTVPCNVTSSFNTSVQCQVPAHPAGPVPVRVHVKGKGQSNPGALFEFDLVLSSVSPTESGFGGGRNISLNGYGFSYNDTVLVCNKTCKMHRALVHDREIICESPTLHVPSFAFDRICSVDVITAAGVSQSLPDAYTYRANLTSTITTVSPRRGGTGGGVRVTISGAGLRSETGAPSVVTIAGNPCVVESSNATNIVCVTAPSSETVKTDVRVDVGQTGKAVPLNASFFYVDVWSSKFSWGGRSPPVAGRRRHCCS